MSDIKVVPLGAGQDVGRSCILVTIQGKNLMLDCGIHMGYNDERRFPDFSYIAPKGPYTEHIDCLIISHFHLDHCGALPYFTEVKGYDGPIYMTHPTKAICPILLEDYAKIAEKRYNKSLFDSESIKKCMEKVTTIGLHQTIRVDADIEIKAYYAGHVLGAAMFHICVGPQSIVYTGDYNMTPDRHLGAAWIDKCQPDLLITESTYATTIRDSKRCREREFLKKIHDTVEKGGKVLIPVFALGRAQELCILLETFWERMNLQAPIYFSAGMTEKANFFYKLFISWTNEKIKKTYDRRNMFEFKHIKSLDWSYVDQPGPMVVFATPGMLHAGSSLQIFKRWAEDENNMVIIPGYCVQGTVGNKILSGSKEVDIEHKLVKVKLTVEYLSFSAHADAKGIMQLIRFIEPRNVMLVHGEVKKMEFLKTQIKIHYNIDSIYPPNGKTEYIVCPPRLSIDLSLHVLAKNLAEKSTMAVQCKKPCLQNDIPVQGILVCKESGSMQLLEQSQACIECGIQDHEMKFQHVVTCEMGHGVSIDQYTDGVYNMVCQTVAKYIPVKRVGNTISICFSTISITLYEKETPKRVPSCSIEISWSFKDDEIANCLINQLKTNEAIFIKPELEEYPSIKPVSSYST